MGIVVVGLSHKTAPVELRERLSLSQDRIESVINGLKNDAAIKEAVVLSTCNRFEIYARPENSRADALVSVKKTFQALYDHPGLEEKIYERESQEAVFHLFRVASGLDSMVIGETEILGQVKNAYLQSQKIGATGKITNVLFQRALFVGKNIRTQTHLSEGASSVGSIAVHLAEKIFGPLNNHNILLLGAGSMAETTARHLLSQKAGRISVLNRTVEKAGEVAKILNGDSGSLEELTERLASTDIVICSTSSPEPLITPALLEKIMPRRRHRSLYFIDIAVPRNVDPAINDIDNVYVYDIDDLQSIVEENLEKRKTAIAEAEGILERAAREFQGWIGDVLEGKRPVLRHQYEKAGKETS